MAAEDTAVEPGDRADGSQLVDSGSYDVIRSRLTAHGRVLRTQTDELNQRRKEVFGGTEMAVVSTVRVRSEHNCVPRDIVTVDGALLVGYNVFLGLKSSTEVSDVLGLQRFSGSGEDVEVAPLPVDGCAGILVDEQFTKDFADLFRYYRDARLLQLRATATRLLAIFQIGRNLEDVKVLRWEIAGDGGVRYLDSRGERDHVLPPPHDFEWTLTTRDDHVSGRHPHVSILDEVFVETVGGDLTVKVEDNTSDGLGIYREPVDDPDQSLDDAEISFARIGQLILLKVLPFRELNHRYYIFNTRTHEVVREDAIGQACVQLPEDHGIVFPGGTYLATGEHKRLPGDTTGMVLERVVRSPNGEDILYVFHQVDEGIYLLLPYNLIRKEVQTPIRCSGYTLLADGAMVLFRLDSAEPTRVHPMQVWQTPFTSAEFAAAAPVDGSFLAKIGNAELVRGISDLYSVVRFIERSEPTRATYEDLVGAVRTVVDAYYWLGHEEVGNPLSTLHAALETSELIIDEFEKVLAIRQRASEALAHARQDLEQLIEAQQTSRWESVDQLMQALSSLRSQRGHLISLRELKAIDRPALDQLEQQAAEAFDRTSEACVQFLLEPEALRPLATQLDEVLGTAEGAETVAELEPLGQRLDELGDGLTVLSDVVGSLQVGEATERTAILQRISEVFAQLNRVRATYDGRRRSLATREGRAEFAAQFALFGQTVANAMALAESPEACDEQLSYLMVQLEQLEGRFSEFDEFLDDLAGKREEVYASFETRKQTLLDERQRRAQNLFAAAERILVGAARRSRTFSTTDELNAYFASDPMVLKLKELSERLLELGDSVRGDEVVSRLKTAQQEAQRALRDRLDLYEEGATVIKLGRHRFSVNTQEPELTLVPKGDSLAVHISGSDFFELVTDPELDEMRDLWDQVLVSETDEVYRGEYLALSVLEAAERQEQELSIGRLQAARVDLEELVGLVERFAAQRYDEGYDRGVHDVDAARILDAVLGLRAGAGLLRMAPSARALACLFWACLGDGPVRERFRARARSLGLLRATFGPSQEMELLAGEVSVQIQEFLADSGIQWEASAVRTAGVYLVEELVTIEPAFATSSGAIDLRNRLVETLEQSGARVGFEQQLEVLADRPGERLRLVWAWLDRLLESQDDSELDSLGPLVPEAAVLLVTERQIERVRTGAMLRVRVEGLLGQHPRIVERAMELRLDEFFERVGQLRHEGAGRFERYREVRQRVLEEARARLRLDEIRPRVLTSFVRNRLINEVYLPLIGDNLAKQLGAAGDEKRTDLMGLLLVISPPGYGKTTLMEYIASRLGLAFIKVNGPALGHRVTSLDPAEAPNATARQEVERINFALEMGNNVMLYLDDIQHTSAELLQKFISLCDAQRRIEGVWKGRSRTYDLRGKKLCVVMAGNPYTESGERFQIPDMLANRADTYNLGDVLTGKDELFALSYLENALTSSSTMAPLAARGLGDFYRFVRAAAGEEVPSTEFEHDYSSVEIGDVTAVIRHLFRVQKLLLTVNQSYIASAAMEDAYRTEPPFQLQGSYRNMNKITERVVPAMTDDEVEQLLDDHYLSEAQTLTTGAEHNLLKLKAMRGRLSNDEKLRWEHITGEFRRQRMLGGGDDDPVVRVTRQLNVLGDRLDGIRSAVDAAAAQARERGTAETTAEHEPQRDNHWEWMAAYLAKLDAVLQSLAKPEAAEAGLAVTVENLPPEGLDRLLVGQVELVENTLVPLAKLMTENVYAGRKLDDRITQILQQVDTLRRQLPSAATQSTANANKARRKKPTPAKGAKPVIKISSARRKR